MDIEAELTKEFQDRGYYNQVASFYHAYDGVEDIVQEAFMYAWRWRKSFKQGCSLRSWIFGIVLNVGRTKRRKALCKKRYGSLPLDEDIGVIIGPVALKRVLMRERGRRLVEVVERLPVRYYNVFWGIMNGSLEIGDDNTLKTRKKRMIARLRKEMK
jgi:DNA-directed RNA polymerase specialized sigma24 family protein